MLDETVGLRVLVDDFHDIEELLNPDFDGVLFLILECETEELLLDIVTLSEVLLEEALLVNEVLLNDPVIDDIFVEIVVLLDDTLLEVLLAVALLDVDNLLEEGLLEDDLIVEALLEDVLTISLLLDLAEKVDEVFELDFFEEDDDDDDLILDFLVEVETGFVLDFFVDVVGLCKTHLQACLTAGTFRLGIGESCRSLFQSVSMTAFSLNILDLQRVKEGTE